MDHLPSFKYADPIRVPYVCEQAFQGSFFDYPDRRGWDKEKLLHRDLQVRSAQQVLSFFQEWLYFGLLRFLLELADLDFHQEDFVFQSDDGRHWISTAKLPQYLERYRSKLDAAKKDLSDEQRIQKRRDITACLQSHHTFALLYCRREADAAKYGPMPSIWPMTPEISVSIGALAAALFLTSFGWMNASLSWLDCVWGVQDAMISSGWCRSLLSEFAAVDDLYTAHTLSGPVIPADHARKHCTLFACNVNQLDEASFQSKHVVDGCECKCRGPPIDEVVQRLRHGFVPIIRVHEGDDGLEVRVVKGSDQVDDTVGYVAISHVCTPFTFLQENPHTSVSNSSL